MGQTPVTRTAAVLEALQAPGATYAVVAAHHGVSRQRVQQIAKRHGVRRRGPRRTPEYWRAIARDRQRARHSTGLCIRCNLPVRAPGAWTCAYHARLAREAQRNRRRLLTSQPTKA